MTDQPTTDDLVEQALIADGWERDVIVPTVWHYLGGDDHRVTTTANERQRMSPLLARIAELEAENADLAEMIESFTPQEQGAEGVGS